MSIVFLSSVIRYTNLITVLLPLHLQKEKREILQCQFLCELLMAVTAACPVSRLIWNLKDVIGVGNSF